MPAITDPTGRSRDRRRFPVRVRSSLALIVLVAVVVLAAVVPVVSVTATGAAAGAAAVQSRRVEPFMAGSVMQSRLGWCTAGLVLKDNSALGGITEYRRSVRFILTAGHCGAVGDAFTTPAGYSVGTVIWKSSVHDFLLIKVEPRLDRGIGPGCEPGSQNLPCVAISSHYYPRAVGRVFTGGAGVSDSVPVNGTTLSGGTIFISGAFSGTTGGYTSIRRPPHFGPDPAGARDLSFTWHSGDLPDDGDSGAPVFSHNGNVFGIHHGIWEDELRGSLTTLGTSYTKVSVFFAEQGGYALAPPQV